MTSFYILEAMNRQVDDGSPDPRLGYNLNHRILEMRFRRSQSSQSRGLCSASLSAAVRLMKIRINVNVEDRFWSA
jgi:hypothetical protein